MGRYAPVRFGLPCYGTSKANNIMADWEEVVRRMEESTERIKKAHADKQAKRVTIQKVGKGDTFMLSKPESTMYLTASRTELYALLSEIRKALQQ